MQKVKLYSSPTSKSDQAVIVLPEIFGLSSETQHTVDRFASEFGIMAFGIDYYQNTEFAGKVFDSLVEKEMAIKAKSSVNGDDFLELLSRAIIQIQTEYPNIQDIIVCGFCFGGRLALLSSANPKVSCVIDFYGAGTTEMFVESQTKNTLQYLTTKDVNPDLRVLGIFGGRDESISEANQLEIKTTLELARINYQEVVFLEAGHGFFNQRQSYNATFANEAWSKVRKFLNINSTILTHTSVEAAQIYQHYKGGLYKILTLAKAEFDFTEVVVYQDLQDSNKVWTRPLQEFLSQIEIDGQIVARFQLI